MEILIGYVRNVDIKTSRNEENVTIQLTEMDGSYYGSKTEIKIPARSYEALEQAIVDKWLDKQKSL